MDGTTTDQPVILLSVSPNSADEDDASTEVTVTASRATTEASDAVTVTLAVDETASTADSGDDYAALGTLPTISLAANQTSNTATIDIDPPRTACRSRAGRRS